MSRQRTGTLERGPDGTGDLHAWDWTMIDLVHFAQCTVARSKTKTPQVLEVPEVLRPFLRAWWARAGCPTSGPVFPVRKGRTAGGFKAPQNSYAGRLRRDLFQAGVYRMPPVEVTATKPGTRTDLGRHATGTKLAPNPSDPLYYETATTLPVDFHSFRRAFNTALAGANVNVQRAMHLAGHSDAKTHMKYVMRSPEMRAIPAEALPRVVGLGVPREPSSSASSVEHDDEDEPKSGAGRLKPRIVRSADDSIGAPRGSAANSARHRGFEPLAYGSGGRRSIQLS
jgi:hypothetical protein